MNMDQKKILFQEFFFHQGRWDIVHLPRNIPGQSDQPRGDQKLGKGDGIVVLVEIVYAELVVVNRHPKVGNMAYDVKLREVRS